MIWQRYRRPGSKNLLLIALVFFTMLSARVALAETAGRGLVVALAAKELESVKRDVARAATGSATGLLLLVDSTALEATSPLVRGTAPVAQKGGLALWIGITKPWAVAPAQLASMPVEQVAGVALVFPAPQGEPAPPGDLKALLRIKRQGDELGQLIRQVKARLPADRQLAICVAASEIEPETTRERYVPIKDLVRDGTVDGVFLSDAERMNFHRLRLLRDAPLQAGILLVAGSSDARGQAGLLERATLAATENATCDSLWVVGFPPSLASQVICRAVIQREQARASQNRLQAAIRDGRLTIDQELSEKGCNDQATVHGVAQSFLPSRDGTCPLVQVYAALRGCSGPLPAPLTVEIRTDDRGKPGSKPLARAEIAAADFGHEPDYRWGSASFDPPVNLKQGNTYWVYLPNARHREGTYVWRLRKDAANQRGRAWSRSYDYSRHSWVFRVFMGEGD